MKTENKKQIPVPRCRMGDPEIEKMLSAPPGTLRIRLEKDDGGAVKLTVFSPHTGWCDELVENNGTAEIQREQCG
ncbi:MAG: hypothetical protein ACYS8W_12100 [Planctomycetota bacterium]